jgi:hypothetical protein
MSAILPLLNTPLVGHPRTPFEPRKAARGDDLPQWRYHQHKQLHPDEHNDANITSAGQSRGVFAGMNQDALLTNNIKVIRSEPPMLRQRAAFTNDGLNNEIKTSPMPWSPLTEPLALNLR